MLTEWNTLPEPLQLAVSRMALTRAADTIATQAELLARAMEEGAIVDRGGPDALRLLACIARVTGDETPAAGQA